MTERSEPSSDPKLAAPADVDAARPQSIPSRRWSLQFGLLEFFGLLCSVSVYYALICAVMREVGRDTSQTEEVRFVAFAVGLLLSGGGSYLSARLATSRNVRSVGERLLLQLAFSFFVVPVLVFVTGFVLFNLFACLFRL